MACRSHALILATFAVLGSLLSACSGGGGSSAPTVLGKSVYWEAPHYFTDGTPLVPSRDLKGFEIYVKKDLPFEPDDYIVATPTSLQNSFYLGDISPPLTPGVTYYVSLKTVTDMGMKSNFSPPVPFSP